MTARTRRRTGSVALALSLALGLAVGLLSATPVVADPGPTTLVGLTDGDAPPVNGSGTPVISGDGSTVLFRSFGEDIEGDAPAGSELYARDRTDSTTEAVDLPPDGVTFPANRSVTYYDTSADGRFVVFDLLTPGACDNSDFRECFDVYWRDRQTGTTKLVSVAPDGTTGGDLDSYDPSISGDGQRVVFQSQATNLVDTELGAPENVFMRDMTTGTTELVSQSTAGQPALSESLGGAISADGETVVFSTGASNLNTGPSGNDLFLRHLDTDTTEAVLPTGLSIPYTQVDPDLDADASVVAFMTNSDLLGTGASTSRYRIYTIDLSDDSIDTAPAHDFQIETVPDISDDGRYVAYRTEQPVNDAPTGIYVWDRQSDTTELESVHSDGSPYTSQPFRDFLSGDGRFVVFETLQPAYAGDVDDATLDALIHDRAEPTDTATGTGAASTADADGPTYDDTLQATVSGSPGEVTVTELETEDPGAQPLDGYVVLGQQVQVTAEAATPPAFLTFTFDVDASIIPGNAVPGDVDLFRDGVALPDCTGATDVGPCVASRSVLPSGDWRFVAHSPEASVWAVALDETPTPPPTDTNPPTITLTSPVEGARYVVGQDVTASYECADDDSGIASCTGTRANGASIDTSTIGTRTFTVEATDNAGNAATRSVTYRVVWPVRGLYYPVDNPPVVNTVRAGAVVPARFTLGGYRGTEVFASGYPQTQAVACPGRPRTDEVEQTLPSSAATLTYRQGVYTYAWRSQRSWASRSTCRRLVVRFRDGQQLTALFRLR